MKLLVITSAFPNFAGDPRGTFVHILARALSRRHIEVTVLAPGAPGAPTKEIVDGVEVQRATYWIPRWQGLAVGLGGIVPNILRKPWLLVQVPALIASLTWHAVRLSRGVHVIHAHWVYPAGIAGAIAKWWRGIPLAITSHGGDLNLANRSRLLRWVTRRISQTADICIGVSHAMVAEFHRLGIAEDRVRFIPLGVEVDPDQGPPSELADLHETFRNFRGFRIVYAGSLIPRKSVDTLIRAHHRLEVRGHEVATLLVGTGPTERSLRDLIAENESKHVFFAGQQAPDRVGLWIGAGNVLILPSLSEGRGLVIVEAMALGRPVVASDIPGPQELVHDGDNGFLFPAGDDEQLADRLERLIEDEPLRERLGKRGMELIEEEGLTPDRCAARHVGLFEEISGREGKRLGDGER